MAVIKVEFFLIDIFKLLYEQNSIMWEFLLSVIYHMIA